MPLSNNPDMELKAVFTRRDPSSLSILTEGAKVYSVADAPAMKDEIDVRSSVAAVLQIFQKQTPEMAKYFNVLDSFDTHAKIPEHFEAVDKAAKESGHIGLISVGWDPYVLLKPSVCKCCSSVGKDYTFWERCKPGDILMLVRRIAGVKDARQYTIPVDSALEAVRSGSEPELTTRQKHTREVLFVVAEEGADLKKDRRRDRYYAKLFC